MHEGEGYLLDVNTLIALLDEAHIHNAVVSTWFSSVRRPWGVCTLVEAGFLRLMANPRLPHAWTMQAARTVLADLEQKPGYRYWSIATPLSQLIAPFRERVFGHQQVTDALLLGLAVHAGGVLVTMDRGMRYLAGPELQRHVLLLSE